MQLSELKAMGAFVSIAPVKKTVEIERPELDAEQNPTGEIIKDTLDVFIRKGSAADAIQMANAGDEDQVFVAIFRSVCNEDGSPLFESVDQAKSLATWLAFPLMNAITEVNSGPKSSRRKTNGASKPASLTASPKQS